MDKLSTPHLVLHELMIDNYPQLINLGTKHNLLTCHYAIIMHTALLLIYNFAYSTDPLVWAIAYCPMSEGVLLFIKVHYYMLLLGS